MLPLPGDEVEAKSKMVDVDDDDDDHEVVDQLLRKLPGARSLPVLPTSGEVFDTSDKVADADDVDVESELVLAAMLESTRVLCKNEIKHRLSTSMVQVCENT